MARRPRLLLLLLALPLGAALERARPAAQVRLAHSSPPAAARHHHAVVALAHNWLPPDHAPAPAFSSDTAREAARLSQLAYAAADARSACAGCAALGLAHAGTVEGGGALALLARRGETLYVAFRGTANLANLASGCDNRLVPLALRGAPSGCAVRAGYRHAFAAVRPRLLEALRGAAAAARAEGAGGLRLIVTGHSLGGSLAALLALGLAAGAERAGRGEPPGLAFSSVEGYTFGAGRLGNEAFAAYFDRHLGPRASASAAFWPLALPADPLTQLPPTRLGFADHAAPHVHILTRGPPPPVVPRLASPVDGALAALAMGACAARELAALAADPARAHRIATYCAALADGRTRISAPGRSARGPRPAAARGQGRGQRTDAPRGLAAGPRRAARGAAASDRREVRP